MLTLIALAQLQAPLTQPVPPDASVDTPPAPIVGAQWVDLDRDGQLELWLAQGDGSAKLYVADPGGVLVDRTAERGLLQAEPWRVASWGDPGGDGWLDLLTLSESGALTLFVSTEGGAFVETPQESVVGAATHFDGARWVDIDGDGRDELWLLGAEPQLLRENGAGAFEPLSFAPPLEPRPGGLSAGVAATAVAPSRDPQIDATATEQPVSNADGTSRPAGPTSIAGTSPEAGTATSAPVEAPAPDAPIAALCLESMRDQATASCLNASSDPLLGALYPLSSDFNLDAGGRVGMGTTTPSEARLHVTEDPATGDAVHAETAVGGAAAMTAISTSISDGFGIKAEANSSVGRAVRAVNEATGGNALALEGVTRSNTGRAVLGIATNSSGENYGVHGESLSPEGTGVRGISNVGGGTGVEGVSTSVSDGVGVRAEANAPVGRAVRGVNEATTGNAIGVEGVTRSETGFGVRGVATASIGNAVGVLGESSADGGIGVSGEGAIGVYGVSEPGGLAGFFEGDAHVSESLAVGTAFPTHTLQVTNLAGNNVMRMEGAGIFGSGAKFNIGDADYVFLHEDVDDSLAIHSTGRTALTGGRVSVGHGIPVARLDAVTTDADDRTLRAHAVGADAIAIEATTYGSLASLPFFQDAAVSASSDSGYWCVVGQNNSVDAQSAVEGRVGSSGVGVLGQGVLATASGMYYPGSGVSGSSGTAHGLVGWYVEPTGSSAGVAGITNSPSGYGVLSFGDMAVSGGTKFFVHPHPEDASKEIRFISLEGNESGTYFRARGSLQGGRAVIEVPEDFRLVSEEDGLSVQLTGVGRGALWVESYDLERIVVRGDEDIEFFCLVNGVRQGFADHETIRENSAYVPNVRGRAYGPWMPDALRQILVENGTLNANNTPNEVTAQRLGWTLLDPHEVTSRPTEYADATPKEQAPREK